MAVEVVRCHGGIMGPMGPTGTMGTFSCPSWHCSLLGCSPPGAVTQWDMVLHWDTAHTVLAKNQELQEGV